MNLSIQQFMNRKLRGTRRSPALLTTTMSAFVFWLSAVGGPVCCLSAFQSGDRNAEAPANRESSRSTLINFDLDSIRLNLADTPVLTIDHAQLPDDVQKSPSVFIDVLSDELETARQVEELGTRIMRLVDLQREQRRRERASSVTPSQEIPIVTSSAENQSAQSTEPLNVSSPRGIVSGNQTGTSSPETVFPDGETTRILTQPPDQLSLADSLFYSGETELALEIYENWRARVQDNNDVWVRFQTACCLRLLGRSDEASTLLREISEEPENNPVVVNSRWYLETIDRKLKLQATLTAFEQFIERKDAEYASDQ